MLPTASDSASSEPAASSETHVGNDDDDDDDDVDSTVMANVTDLLIVSYNMRGYFQGIEVAKDLVNSAKSPDRIAAFGQECVFVLERNKGRYC